MGCGVQAACAAQYHIGGRLQSRKAGAPYRDAREARSRRHPDEAGVSWRMTRRDLMAAALLAPQASSAKMLLKPPVLKAGDTVGLITPSTYVSDPDRIAAATRTIEYFGLKMKMGRNVRKQTGYVGGT